MCSNGDEGIHSNQTGSDRMREVGQQVGGVFDEDEGEDEGDDEGDYEGVRCAVWCL